MFANESAAILSSTVTKNAMMAILTQTMAAAPNV